MRSDTEKAAQEQRAAADVAALHQATLEATQKEAAYEQGMSELREKRRREKEALDRLWSEHRNGISITLTAKQTNGSVASPTNSSAFGTRRACSIHSVERPIGNAWASKQRVRCAWCVTERWLTARSYRRVRS